MLNLTPHTITIIIHGQPVDFPASGTLARVEMTQTEVGRLNGVPLIQNRAGQVTGLPDDGTPCLVSGMVLAALPFGTPNVYAPDTGGTAVRNEVGHIVAVTRLITTLGPVMP